MRICRSIQVEGAFGLLKNDFGFRRFLTRGKRNVRTELFLLGMGFNLKKRWKKQQAGRLKTHLSVLDSAYGEHFEQQPIDTEDGDLYVSFRNSGDNYSIMTRDELDEYIDNQGMTMGEM